MLTRVIMVSPSIDNDLFLDMQAKVSEKLGLSAGEVIFADYRISEVSDGLVMLSDLCSEIHKLNIEEVDYSVFIYGDFIEDAYCMSVASICKTYNIKAMLDLKPIADTLSQEEN